MAAACLAALVVLVVLALREPPLSSAAACPGCNVVLISADTLRADHLGCYGYARDTSPAIDRFAVESVRFARFYSASAWTLPGHLAMLTGRYPLREHEFAFHAPAPMPESEVTLAQRLKQAGYATAGFTGGGYVDAAFGFGRGFDVYTSASEHFAGNQADAARWLSSRDPRQPFFLFLHGYDVHAPYAAPEDVRGRFGVETPLQCRGVELRCDAADYECLHGPDGSAFLASQYDAEIAGVDAALRWLLDELERRDLARNTIVVFTADHGENLMEPPAGVCGHAGDLREPVFRVPLILRVPGQTPKTIDTRASLVDLVPTLLDLVGVEPTAPAMHGESLRRIIAGDAPDRQINGVTSLEAGYYVLAVIAGDTKLVAQRSEWNAPWNFQLFDLGRDPDGHDDLAPTTSSRALARMKRRLFEWTKNVDLQLEPSSSPAKELAPDVRERLRALGYR